MRRSALAASAALAVALLSAAACTSLKEDEPPPTGADGSTPSPTVTPGDSAPPDATTPRDDAASADGSTCPTACTKRAVSTCNGSTSETTLGFGRCVAGACSYPKVQRACRSGCRDGLCTELTWATSLGAAAGPYYAVWGATPDDLWAAGATVAHFDGTRWAPADLSAVLQGRRVFAIAGASRDDVAMLIGNSGGGATALVRREGGTFRELTTLPSCSDPGGSLFAHTPTEYFVHCGDRGIFRVRLSPLDVTAIVPSPGSFPAGQPLHNALDGFVFDDGELTLMGAGTQVGYFYSNLDGGKVVTGGTRAVSVLNARDVYGFLEIGLEATLYPTDGGAPRTTTLNTAIGESEGYYRSMVGTGMNRVFVGGSRAVVAHYDGQSWHRDVVPEAGATTPFVSMWASPWGDVFASGASVWQGQ